MKNIFGLILLLTACTIYSCTTKSEDIHNHVTITINNPTNNSTVANSSAVPFDITVAAAVELHDVEITLTDSTNTSIPPFNPMDVHVHTKTHQVQETVNLSNYAAGSTFKLTVKACEDHDCSESETETITFKI